MLIIVVYFRKYQDPEEFFLIMEGFWMILLESGKGMQKFIFLIKRIDIEISGNNIYRVMENQPIQSILEIS